MKVTGMKGNSGSKFSSNLPTVFLAENQHQDQNGDMVESLGHAGQPGMPNSSSDTPWVTETPNSRPDSNSTSHEGDPPAPAQRKEAMRFIMQAGTVCEACAESNNNSSKYRTENNHLWNDNN